MSISFKFKSFSSEVKAVFLSQICFNFSFVGFKSIFVLYALHHLGLPQKESIDLFAILMTLSYASSLLGGYLSDKFLNPRRCQIMGSLLCVTSMIVFLYGSKQFLYLAMALLSIGSGCLKPNISALLASLFKDPQDSAKDTAFTYLYLCMNVGNFLGPLVCSILCHNYGWTQGLAAIAASFAMGAAVLFHGLKQQRTSDQKVKVTKAFQVGVIIGLSLTTVCYLLQSSVYRPILLAIIVVFSLLSFGLMYYNCTQQERLNLHKIIGYIACFALFCSLFEQAGSTITLFIEKAVDRHIFNYVLPSSSLMSFNPIDILILGLLLPALTKRFLEKDKPLESTSKMSIGFFFVSLSFALLSFAASAYILQSFVPLPYVLTAFLIQSIGELYIVPITLSNITKYAPPRYLSTLLSFWLLAIGYGHYCAGILSSLFLRSTEENTLLYGQFFTKLGVISIIITLVLGIMSWYQYAKNRTKKDFDKYKN